jgi:hypothetical protein
MALTCACGATVAGGAWHLGQHQKTARHRDAMGTAQQAPLAAPPFVLVEQTPQEQPRTTLRRMADVLRGHKADAEPEPTVGDAFDGHATLAFDDAPPVWPRNPVPTGEPSRRSGTRAPRGRPAGAEDLTPLFATGLVLLTTFAVGEWASPTADEANAIAVPLSNIMARRIDLAAKLGRDASDTIALVVALMAYSYRVVPVAAERVRYSLDERRAHRVSRSGTDRATEPANGQGADGVAYGSGNGQDPNAGPTYDPFDAVTKARSLGLGVLDRGFGSPTNGSPAVGS